MAQKREGAKKPFWEESYKRKGKFDTFGGGKPSKEVYDAAKKEIEAVRFSDSLIFTELSAYSELYPTPG